MSHETLLTLAAVGIGFLCGYGLGRHTGKTDTQFTVAQHVWMLREVGGRMASRGDGRVPWDTINEALEHFPGQREGRR